MGSEMCIRDRGVSLERYLGFDLLADKEIASRLEEARQHIAAGGIPLEKQSSIFNRFEKLNEGAQGTGLGLSICQLIIERIGGSIWIDPAYTTGCRFYFTHPINPTKEGKEAQS